MRQNVTRQQVIPYYGIPATGAGAATLMLTGSQHVEVGDRILMVMKPDSVSGSTGGNYTAYFESVVTVRDQVQQTSTENLRATISNLIFFVSPKSPQV
jgi:hypothetical protein